MHVRKDTLAWLRLKCHVRRRARLAGLQRPRATSCQQMLLLLQLPRPAANTDTEGAAGLRCIPLVVLTNSMPGCAPAHPHAMQNHGCLADASKSNGALLNLYTADACFAHTSTDTLCRCVSALRS